MSLYTAVLLKCAQYLDKSAYLMADLLLQADSPYSRMTPAECDDFVPQRLIPARLTGQHIADARESGARLLSQVTIGEAPLLSLMEDLFDRFVKETMTTLMEYVSRSDERRHALAKDKELQQRAAVLDNKLAQRCEELRRERSDDAAKQKAQLLHEIAKLQSEVRSLQCAADLAIAPRSTPSPRSSPTKASPATPRSPTYPQGASALTDRFVVVAEVENTLQWLTWTLQKDDPVSPTQQTMTSSTAEGAAPAVSDPSLVWRACSASYSAALDSLLVKHAAQWQQREQGTLVAAGFSDADAAFAFAHQASAAAAKLCVTFQGRRIPTPGHVRAVVVHHSGAAATDPWETVASGAAELLQCGMMAQAGVANPDTPVWLSRVERALRGAPVEESWILSTVRPTVPIPSAATELVDMFAWIGDGLTAVDGAAAGTPHSLTPTALWMTNAANARSVAGPNASGRRRSSASSAVCGRCTALTSAGPVARFAQQLRARAPSLQVEKPPGTKAAATTAVDFSRGVLCCLTLVGFDAAFKASPQQATATVADVAQRCRQVLARRAAASKTGAVSTILGFEVIDPEYQGSASKAVLTFAFCHAAVAMAFVREACEAVDATVAWSVECSAAVQSTKVGLASCLVDYDAETDSTALEDRQLFVACAAHNTAAGGTVDTAPQRALIGLTLNPTHPAALRASSLLWSAGEGECVLAPTVAARLEDDPVKLLAMSLPPTFQRLPGTASVEGRAVAYISAASPVPILARAPTLPRLGAPQGSTSGSGNGDSIVIVAMVIEGPLWLPAVDPIAAAEVVETFERLLADALNRSQGAVLSYDRAQGSVCLAFGSADVAVQTCNELHLGLLGANWSAAVLRYKPFAVTVAPMSAGGTLQGGQQAPAAASIDSSASVAGGATATAGTYNGLISEANVPRVLYAGPALRCGVASGMDGLMPVLRAVELCDSAAAGETLTDNSTAQLVVARLSSTLIAPLDKAEREALHKTHPSLNAVAAPCRVFPNPFLRLRRIATLAPRRQFVALGSGCGAALMLRHVRLAAVAGGVLDRGMVEAAERLAVEDGIGAPRPGWRSVGAADVVLALARLRQRDWQPRELLHGVLTTLDDCCHLPLERLGDAGVVRTTPPVGHHHHPQSGAAAAARHRRLQPSSPSPTKQQHNTVELRDEEWEALTRGACPLTLFLPSGSGLARSGERVHCGALGWLPSVTPHAFVIAPPRRTAALRGREAARPHHADASGGGSATSSALPGMRLTYAKYVALRAKYDELAKDFNRALATRAVDENGDANGPWSNRRLVPFPALRELHSDVASTWSSTMPLVLPEHVRQRGQWPASRQQNQATLIDDNVFVRDAATEDPVSRETRQFVTLHPTPLYSFDDVIDLYFPDTAPLLLEGFDADYRAGVTAVASDPAPSSLSPTAAPTASALPRARSASLAGGRPTGKFDERKMLEYKNKAFAAVVDGEALTRACIKEIYAERIATIKAMAKASLDSLAFGREKNELIAQTAAVSKKLATQQQELVQLRATTLEVSKLKERLKTERRDAASSENELARCLAKAHYVAHALGGLVESLYSTPSETTGQRPVSEAQLFEDWFQLLDAVQSDSLNPFAPLPKVVPRRVTGDAGQRALLKYREAAEVLAIGVSDVSENTSPEKLLLSTFCAIYAVFEAAQARVTTLTADVQSALQRVHEAETKAAAAAAQAAMAATAVTSAGAVNTNSPTRKASVVRNTTSSDALEKSSNIAAAKRVKDEPKPSPTSPPIPAAGRISLHPQNSKPPAHHALGSRGVEDDDDNDSDDGSHRRRRIVFNVVLGHHGGEPSKDTPTPSIDRFESGREVCDACLERIAYVACPGCWNAKLCGQCCVALHDVLPPALLSRAVHVTPSEDGMLNQYRGGTFSVTRLGGSHVRIRDQVHRDAVVAAPLAPHHHHARHLHALNRAQGLDGAGSNDVVHTRPMSPRGGLGVAPDLAVVPSATAVPSVRSAAPGSATHRRALSAKASANVAKAEKQLKLLLEQH